MKKIMTLVMVGALLLTTVGITFAQEGITDPMRRALLTRQETRYFGEGLSAQVMQIREKNLTIRQLHLQLQSKLQELRLALQQDQDLNEAEIAEIREGLRLIRVNRRSLGATFGEVRAEMLRLRANRLEQNLEGFKQNLEHVHIILENRMTLLEQLLNDTDVLLAKLQ